MLVRGSTLGPGIVINNNYSFSDTRLRVWFNGRTAGCQSADGGSIPPTRIIENYSAARIKTAKEPVKNIGSNHIL